MSLIVPLQVTVESSRGSIAISTIGTLVVTNTGRANPDGRTVYEAKYTTSDDRFAAAVVKHHRDEGAEKLAALAWSAIAAALARQQPEPSEAA